MNIWSSELHAPKEHGKNGFVAATKLGQQIKFLLLQQPNVLLTELNILLL